MDATTSLTVARELAARGQRSNESGKPHEEVQSYALLSIAHSLIAICLNDDTEAPIE